ncbi:MAG: hypothetical protein K2M07_04785 [Muribaculaceae bacterium]|nr:hypothetical protein [Muribaculaceae bacterium]
MKKIYAFCLLLTMLLFTSNKASALSTTIEWDIPGSVMLKTGSTSEPFVDLSSDQTSYTFNTTETYGSIYIYAADGYTLIDAETTDGASKYIPSTWANPHFINIYASLGNGMDGKTVKVNCIKTERNDSFNINVINGLDYLKASFASGYELSLKEGENAYMFNPLIDGNLTINLVGINNAYSVTLDGEPVEKYPYGARYDDIKIANGSNLAIQVFESEADIPKDCSFTIEYGEGMNGCITNIYNRTTGNFSYPKDFVNNTTVFKGGSTIKININVDDYTVTAVYLNDEDITDKYIYSNSSFGKSGYIEIDVPNDSQATLKIEGTAVKYDDIEFTGYISGAEGVEFSYTYSGDAITLPAGESFSGEYTIGAFTLNSENAEKFIIPVSEKIGKIFFRPKQGYYIAELYTQLGNAAAEQHSGTSSIFPNSDGTTFYMVVKELPATYSFNVTTTGSTYNGRLILNPQVSNWGNPDGSVTRLTEGEKTFSFIPVYQTPLTVSVQGSDNISPAVYLDGAPLTSFLNSESGATEFSFEPYYPTEGSLVAEGVKSDVKVYLSTARPTMSGASLVVEDGLEAGFFYSAARHNANPDGQTLISGTQMIVKPASANVQVKYKDETVSLDENGEFVFTVTGNARNNIVTVSAASEPVKYADMLVNPEDGATVKSLSAIKVTLPVIDPNYESMLDYNEEVLPQVVVKKGEEVVATFGELGDPAEDAEGNMIVSIILSAPVTEAGEYTIDIPEKAFVQKAWSEADDAMMPVSGGFVTPAFNGKVTVDPTMISICDDYTLDPVSGSKVESIEEVKISFNKISSEEYFSGWEFQNATFTNGEQTVQAIVNYDWTGESENRVMKVTPVDEEEEPAAITAAGTWTMTIAAGTFTYQGESNGEITAEYTIEAPVEDKVADMIVSPADGATVKSLSVIKITLPVVDPNFETMLDVNEEVLPQLAVKKGEEVVATFGELGDPSADDEGNTIVPIYLSEAITEAGEYTIDIPAKAFVEKGWSEADDAMMPVAGGYVTPAYAGTVTVDPSMISICDDYSLDPVAGSEVESIEVVKVTFNKISSEEYFNGWEFQNATFTNGDQTFQAIVNYDWMSESENRIMTVTPVDEAEEPVAITAAGKWTMTIAAGTFNYQGESNGEISAEYTVVANTPAYTITPEPGTTVDNLAEIKIEFTDATEIEYNEIPVTLKGSEYNASTTDVLGVGNSRTAYFRNPTVDGEYTVTFPAGAFTIDGKESEEVTATYTFKSSYVLTPESGSTLEKFEVAIAFPNATEVALVGDLSSILLTNNHSYASPTMNCVKDENASVPTFILTIPESAQQPPVGSYNLIIEEGVFQIDGKPSVAIYADYNIDHEVSTEYTLTPENGVIVYEDWGYTFAFIFDEAATLSRPDASKIELTFDGETIPAASYETGVEMNMLMFMVFDSNYCKDGVIKANIAEGAFKIGKTNCPAIQAEWTLTAPKSFEASVTPAENDSDNKIASIETVILQFPEATSGEVYNEYGASLRSNDYSYFETGVIKKEETADLLAEGEAKGVTFSITFKKTTDAGTYNLNVREGTFVLDGVHNSPELNATYYVDPVGSGIEGIFADENGNVTVYSIDGRIIIDNAPAAEIKTLKKGVIYIINGKKVVLK